MIKIFYIDPQSGDNLAMYDYELLSRLKKYDIFYICSNTYNYKSLYNTRNYPIFGYTIKKHPVVKGISYIISLIKLYIKIRTERPEVIHIQWFRLPKTEYWFYKFLKYKYKFSLIHTVHNTLPHIRRKSHFRDYSKLYKLCDFLITHTDTSAKKIELSFNIIKNKIIVAPHGPLKYTIPPASINNHIAELKEKFGIKSKYIVSLLGYQSLYKGTDLAVDAWRSSEELYNNSDICLIVAGKNNDYRTETFDNDKNIVIINNHLSDLTFISLMRMSSLILLPYREIDQSGVLLTILEEKIPYCATRVGELTRPIECYNIGWIIEMATITGVRDTLEQIFRDPNVIEMKKNLYNSLNTTSQQYSWEAASAITSKVYNKAVNEI